MFEDEDMPYEEDCLRNPYSLKTWLRYIDYKTKNSNNWALVYITYERAVKQIPGR